METSPPYLSIKKRMLFSRRLIEIADVRVKSRAKYMVSGAKVLALFHQKPYIWRATANEELRSEFVVAHHLPEADDACYYLAITKCAPSPLRAEAARLYMCFKECIFYAQISSFGVFYC